MRTRYAATLLTVVAGCGGGSMVTDASDLDASTTPDVRADTGWSTLADGRVNGGPFITRVVSFDPGPNAGFGQSGLPGIVYGPPVGGGDNHGGTDVVSLGQGGRICVALDDVGIIDGPGPDFVVFENPFVIAGTTTVYAELGEVSVSVDGVTYATFPCAQAASPYTGCAGWHPVYSTPTNGISPFDLAHAGGDPFDLADVGISGVHYVCIHDLNTQNAPPPAAGFDLDGIAAVNWQ